MEREIGKFEMAGEVRECVNDMMGMLRDYRGERAPWTHEFVAALLRNTFEIMDAVIAYADEHPEAANAENANMWDIDRINDADYELAESVRRLKAASWKE